LLDIEGRGWDFDKLIRIFNPADAEEIAKIKLQPRLPDDFIAWHMEKNGLFSVRSAYNLALKIKTLPRCQATSAAPGGERKLWSRVWSGRVPPKVNVSIWKLARDILPTRRAKFIRKIEASDICPLCSRDVESSYHATVTCPQARGLRMAMRDHWQLPAESQFKYTGPDWTLLLLDQCSDSVRDQVKQLLWKTWAVRNNITHQAGPTSISEAVHALCAMQSTFFEELPAGDKVGGKGKAPCLPCDIRNAQ
jgi:hypothetical protein